MTRVGHSTLLPILSCVLIGLCLSACGGGSGGGGTPGTPPPTGGSGPFALSGLATDAFMTIEEVALTADNRFKVTFLLEDNGTPLSLADLDRDPRFIPAYIVTDPITGYTKYESFVLRTAT